MALQIKIELSSGILIEDAYCRIGSVVGNKNNITIMVDTFMNREKCSEGKSIVQ
ncbi:hypothetical protein NSS82_10355 [Paenibacillus sp. FSL H7-0735]|uniref:hypothetical protein n=1 Tax=Paenibacillus sp. FSL H7-0735 TaxID=2954736 RepID=UPI0030FA58BF